MAIFTTKDKTDIYYKDWGSGRPVVFSHGWPLSSDAWEDQMLSLGSHGYRCVAHDRRGHGRSSQTWGGNDIDTYADDLAQLVEHLDLREAVHVGHSTGGGEVVRYLGKYGSGRAAKAILLSSIPPVMVKSATNPLGTPIEVFDGLRKGIQVDRSQFFLDFALPFYGYNRTGAKKSQGVIDFFWLQSMMCGMPGAYFCVKAFSETDLTEDLKKIDVPVHFLHGDDDQIVPIKDASELAVKLVKNGTLKIYPGAPHGMATTLKDEINAELLNLIGSEARVPVSP